jgi:TPR repeat protein
LAAAYMDGDGLVADPVEALKWLLLAFQTDDRPRGVANRVFDRHPDLFFLLRGDLDPIAYEDAVDRRARLLATLDQSEISRAKALAAEFQTIPPPIPPID